MENRLLAKQQAHSFATVKKKKETLRGVPVVLLISNLDDNMCT